MEIGNEGLINVDRLSTLHFKEENLSYHSLWDITELVMKVFSYLDVFSLATVSQTCTHFSSIASNDFLWKKFIRTQLQNKFPDDTMKSIYAAQFKKLKECHSQNIEDFGIYLPRKIIMKIVKDEVQKISKDLKHDYNIWILDSLKPILEYLNEFERAEVAGLVAEKNVGNFHNKFQEILIKFDLVDLNIINFLLAKTILLHNKLWTMGINFFIEEILKISDEKQIEDIKNYISILEAEIKGKEFESDEELEMKNKEPKMKEKEKEFETKNNENSSISRCIVS